MQRWKGMHVFVDAMARVFEKVPDAEGVIVGGMFKLEPDYEPWLRARVRELGMKEKIRMVGVQRNVPEWMQAMDVFVHASEREPFGIVVIEAMSLGKPVIATKPGGPEEIITDGVDGQLVTWNQPEELAAAILKYLQDPDWARSVGQRAMQRSQEYTMEKYAARVGDAVRKLVKKRTA
jgi:glycosyltransferase involved in cell wall biosynthesis